MIFYAKNKIINIPFYNIDYISNVYEYYNLFVNKSSEKADGYTKITLEKDITFDYLNKNNLKRFFLLKSSGSTVQVSVDYFINFNNIKEIEYVPKENKVIISTIEEVGNNVYELNNIREENFTNFIEKIVEEGK